MNEIVDAKESDITDVHLISVTGSFLGPKNDRESRARTYIFEYLKKKYYDTNIKMNTINIDCNDLPMNTYGLAQPLFWIPSLMTNVNCMKYDNVDLILSDISGDPLLLYRTEITNIIESTAKLKYCTDDYNNKVNITKIKTKFIQSFIYKEDIITSLIKSDPELFYHCTTCENYKDESDNCGVCDKCKEIIQALKSVISDADTDAEVKKICEAYLYDKFKMIYKVLVDKVHN